MRKIFLLIFLLITTLAYSQLNNSWIDYSKTYYKFTGINSGLYRITESTLNSLGLSNVPAEQFQLWQNGQEVMLYTSVSSGLMGSNDFIEFYGKANNGVTDNGLYRNPTYQLCDSVSLFTDTASYFLTVNSTATTLRYLSAANNTASNTLSPEPYFMRRVDMPFRDRINYGIAQDAGEYVYSASYDIGEGWTTNDIYPGNPYQFQMSNLNVYTGGPTNNVSLYLAAAGNALNNRNLIIGLFDSAIINKPISQFGTFKTTINNLSLSLLKGNNYASFLFSNNSTNINDRVVVSEIALTYPATFNFNNQTCFNFQLSSSTTGNFLQISNFNNGGVAPVLYDLTENKRYIGDISVSGLVQFELPPSSFSTRNFVLMSQAATAVTNETNLTVRNFINFSNNANQGNYLIISNKALFDNGSGVNYVDLYRQYRASTAGGSFNPKIYTIDELTDQFAFGIKNNPAAIRDFIRYSTQQFSVKPEYVLIIGHGITYYDARLNETAPYVNQLDLVPTFGWPASDVLLACQPGTNVPIIPIGRLSVINGNELSNFLDKIKQYESAQNTPSPAIADKAWMKQIMDVTGGSSSDEDQEFTQFMTNYSVIQTDTLMGANVQIFQKLSTQAVVQANTDAITSLINNGLGMITYFGHSSANLLAFNLSTPQDYSNVGKYPFFNVSGCAAGNFFNYDPLRLTGNLSLSEQYVLSPQRGSIAFFADTFLGIPTYLDIYNNQFYLAMCKLMYGNSVGNQLKQTISVIAPGIPESEIEQRMHIEELTLHGDPAMKMYSPSLPDYAIEDPMVAINPVNISVADNSFTVSIKMMNIGKAINDSIRILVTRKLPNGTIQTLYNHYRPGIKYIDSLNFTIPINPSTDKGANSITVLLNADNNVPEIYLTNNSVTKNFNIYENELIPIYPYNYSIINHQNITFSASTANPLLAQSQYFMEIDTSGLFDSPFKKQYTVTSVGGLVQFTPTNLTFSDSTVYYWRTSIAASKSTPVVWNNFSFVYLANSTTGFNQSHYYQHLQSSFYDMSLDPDRVFRFLKTNQNLEIRTGLYPYFTYDQIDINLSGNRLDYNGCHFNELQIAVFDTTTLLPWQNYAVTKNGVTTGRFGSITPCSTPIRYFFEFPYDDSVHRRMAMQFLDSIPNGLYVSITNLATDENIPATTVLKNSTFISDWQADQVNLGTGISLYSKLKSIGFTKIDSFYKNIPFMYFYKKNRSSYVPQQFVGLQSTDYLDETFVLPSSQTSGTITSPVYGPAKKWNSLHWRGTSVEMPSTDSVKTEVYGIKNDGTSVLLTTVASALDTTLAFIDPVMFPFLQLKMYDIDTVYSTPNQLKYWRVNADYLPEGAVAPNIFYSMKDTANQGDKINFGLAFKNVSPVAFDSLKLKLSITNNSNVTNVIALPKTKPLVSGDTVKVNYVIDTKNLIGNNTIYLMFNSDSSQPEQYLFNNFVYNPLYVKADNYTPSMDVTFDGVHILNHDIVSASPHILIKMQETSQSLALSDTSLINVQVVFPDGTTHQYSYKDLLNFTPANLAAGQNTASVEFAPSFPQDGEYQLIVSGKNANGIPAGSSSYQVLFDVVNKAMISNLLNYPNPFTSSTAFVFTVTGSQPPQNIRIEILTITGKIVKEITSADLGPIHVGRNITEYKWDGTDTYGQKLANGVYLYRVLTNLNGKSLSEYKATGDNTDSYFTKGYGKMYLMR